MLKFTDTNIFKDYISSSPSDLGVLRSIIQEISSGNISPDLDQCLIKFDDIQHHVVDLQKKNNNADQLIVKGINLFKENRIILLNGELSDYRHYKLPPFILFVPIPAKNILIFNINGLRKTAWKKVSDGKYTYQLSNPLTELKFIFVTAYVMYTILVENNVDNIYNNTKLMQLISPVFVDFFKKAIGRSGAAIDDWDKDKLNYVITKFFYVHALGFNEMEAEKAVVNMYSYTDYEVSDVKLSEENIDYTNFNTFVVSLSKIFYKKELKPAEVINFWINSFGLSIFTEVEYFPAFLTHLFILIFNVEFVNGKYDLKSRDVIYQRISSVIK